MDDVAFRALLDLMMVSDPWPLEWGHETVTDMLDSHARERGFMDWIDAYHAFDHPGMRSAR